MTASLIDSASRQLVRAARDDVDTVRRSLQITAGDGKRPTVAQLNAIMASLDNVSAFLGAALSGDLGKSRSTL